MRRKNTKFIDPRYFMDEKMEEPTIAEYQIGQKEMPALAYEPSVAPPEMAPEKRLEWLNYQIEMSRIPTQREKWEEERDQLLIDHPGLGSEIEAQPE